MTPDGFIEQLQLLDPDAIVVSANDDGVTTILTSCCPPGQAYVIFPNVLELEPSELFL